MKRLAICVLPTITLFTMLLSTVVHAQIDDPFVFNAPHERFCVSHRSQGYTVTVPITEEPFDIGCLVDHVARDPSLHELESWSVVNVLDTLVEKYPNPPENPTLIEKIAFVKNQITPIVQSYPQGTIYVIGNEPDVQLGNRNGQTFYRQDSEYPQDYAVIYHDMYEHIRSLDPTATIVPAGIVQATPLRLAYLDTVISTYEAQYGEKMPVDAWNLHNFIANESTSGWGPGIPLGSSATIGLELSLDQNDDMNLFRQNIIDFRQWMADNGYHNTPLVVYEYGILMPELFGYPTSRVSQFMVDSSDYMLTATDDQTGYPADNNRLVQQWAWHSLNDPPYTLEIRTGSNGNLVDPDTGVITATGLAFQEYIRADISVESVMAVQDGANAVVDIELRNLGIEPVRDATLLVLLTDENDVSRQESIQIVDLFGGENRQQFQIIFDDATVGENEITIFADSGSAIVENSEVNNTASTSIQINDIRPDIAINSINAVPNDSENSVTVDVILSNVGVTAVDDTDVLVALVDENNVVVFERTVQISNLINGEIQPIQVVFTDVPNGMYTVRVTADSDALIPEVFETNNSFDGSVEVQAVLLPDLTVELEAFRQAGHRFSVDFVVSNEGGDLVPEVDVVVSVITPEGEMMEDNVTLSNLTAGGEQAQTIQFSFEELFHAEYTVTIEVDPNDVIVESSEDNNRFEEQVDPSAEDRYENDNDCAEAAWLPADGTIQTHTFHDAADRDWIKFDASGDTTYVVSGVPSLDSPADLILEMFDVCEGVPTKGQSYTFATGVRIEFTAPTTGTIYLHWLNQNPTVHGREVAYDVSVRALGGDGEAGATIIVAGRLDGDDDLQPNIEAVTQDA